MTRLSAWLVACLLALLLAVGARGALAAPPAARVPVERVVVTLKQQASLTGITGSRAARLREVIRRHQVDSDRGYTRFRTRLAAWRQTGQITAIKRFWVFNGFAITATPAVVDALAADPAVARVTMDAATIVPAAAGPSEWNIAGVGAPSLWNLGDTGQGVVVASLDSGVDVDHPDLAGSWRGGTNSWFDPFGQHPTAPTDLSGHGTQVMGVMVGGGAGGTAVGVAPGARWIAARIFNDQGTSTLSTTHQAFQWLLDPDGNPATNDAPQVVNGSWSFASGGCNLEFAQDIQSLRSAGILPVFAAGNFGGVSASPANNPGALAVGSTTKTDAIATDSSRGPSACGEPSTTFPELTAPGVGIRTTDLGGLYATQSGTSLAAPHVAGALALLLSAHPTLTPAQQEAALEQSAVDLGAAGPDNTFGYGRLDIVAAYQSIATLPSDSVGPVVSGVAATPGVTATAQVALTATAVDAAGTTAGAEWFDGADPGVGAGNAMAAGDGAFDQPAEALKATIDAAALTPGAHTIAVRARDAAGNWGAPATTTLIIDRTGPVVAGLLANPNPTNLPAPSPFDLPAGNTTTFALTAMATDNDSTVAQAEWFTGADPGPGNGTAVDVAGASLSAAVNSVALGWLDGSRVISVRARDALGNWGTPVQVSVAIVRPNVIFRDGFENGSASAWSTTTGAGRLAFVPAPRVAGTGTVGMRVTLSGTVGGARPGSAYLTDNSPVAEGTYHARFSLDPNASRPGGGTNGIIILGGYTANDGGGSNRFTVRYRLNRGARQVRLTAARSGGTTSTRWFTVPNATATRIEVFWQAGASTTATLSLDGARAQTLTALDTGTASRIESARFGVQSLSGSNARRAGSIFLDAFASARRTVVRP